MLRSPGGSDLLQRKSSVKTVSETIDRYLKEHVGKLGSTKKQVLTFVRDSRCEFSDVKLCEIEPGNIRAFAAELKNNGAGPATVSSYLSHLCHVLRHAEDDYDKSYRVSIDTITRGLASAKRNGFSGKSNVRERRPTHDEIDLLMTFFMKRSAQDIRCVPMHLIMSFAIFGLRRQSEIVGLKWADLEDEDLVVRATKHPNKPDGVDLNTKITEEARRIIKIHGQKDSTRIFPYSAGAVSRLFTDTCKLLEIEDLHFHDLRHEGVSWLLERGWTAPHTMMVSGHSALQTFNRYANVRDRGDKYEDWKWWVILDS